MSDIRRFLQEHYTFQFLEPEQLEFLIEKSKLITANKNQTIIHAMDDGHDVYLLLSGMCKNSILSDEGKEITIRFYHPGDIAGIISAMAQQGSNFTVQTVAVSDFLVIPQHIFHQLLHENSDFSEMVAKEMSKRVFEMYQVLHNEFSYQAQGMETYPYRKKIGEIMTSPVVRMKGNPNAVEMAHLMAEEKVSSVVIFDDKHPLKAIVTERDIIRQVAEGKKLQQTRVSEIVNQPSIISLPPEAYFYEALLVMAKHHIKHIPVINDNEVIGMVTWRNLTQARGIAVLSVVDEIEKQTTLEGLAQAKTHIRSFLDNMLKEKASAHEICSIISEFNDRLLRRVIALAEQAMIAEGFGPPPVEYCWLTMGSEGRKEQTLATDQDNGLIYQDVNALEQKRVENYFAKLAEKVVSGLEKCGIPRCEGDVMATNPKWRHSLSGWKQTIDHWINNLDGNEVRYFTIFLDFRGVYGQMELAREVREHLQNRSNKQSLLFHQLAKDDSLYSVPIGMFGRFITEKGENGEPSIDLKHGGVMHIVNAMRIFSLREGIVKCSTTERMMELAEQGIFNPDEFREIKEAFDSLMLFRIRENIKKIDSNRKYSNHIVLEKMNKNDRFTLKKALTTVKWVQQMTERHFHVRG